MITNKAKIKINKGICNYSYKAILTECLPDESVIG